MSKFFKPAKWEKVGDAVKFKSASSNITGEIKNENKKAAKKLKKKLKKAAKHNLQPLKGKGPLAPKPAAATSEQKITKIKAGRIEKKSVKKKNDKKQINMSKIKAAAAAFAGLGADDDDDNEVAGSASIAATASSFEARLKEQLMGGRFRYLNEQLYTMDSTKAMALFKEDPAAFDAYHAGYRHQVEKWPMNPLKRIIKAIRRLPKSLEIGDFGCGEGKLAQSVPNKVFSMDLVSCRDDIIACDMANTSLQTHSLDVAVYCLSLMGTNLKDYLLEANRVLKMGGLLLVAEIQSRFTDLRAFIKCLEACGFELVKKDVSVKVFYFFEFKKIRNVGRVAVIPPCELKPCLYRKR